MISLRRLHAARCRNRALSTITDGFRLDKVHEFPEHNRTVYEMTHLETSAQYMHVRCPDPNKTMAILFRTPPTDDTGVAHILEHSVLCGSEKYPVRDPFFHMLRRSLHTFMNAMTGPDYTVYPFSTCHEKDFENLLSVYCDAVFRPLLKPDDFRQEGHRLEYQDWSRPESGLAIKGIVFNEMKGAMSDPSSILYHEILRRIVPETPYRFNSGGDPLHIPELSHSQLVQFHRDHYHPSNAKFFSYGNFDAPLRYINEQVLCGFGSRLDLEKATVVPIQPKWSSPPELQRFSCPPETMPLDPLKQSTLSKSYLLSEITSSDPVELTALSLMSSFLVSGADSPFHRALIAPNIGSGYSPMTGLSGNRQKIWSIGLQGIADTDVDSVSTIINRTVEDFVAGSIPKSRVEAVFHQYRLEQKELKTDMGLQLLYRILNRWLHGGDAVSALKTDAHLAEIEGRMAETPYIQNLVEKHLINNPHSLSSMMCPDERFIESRSRLEEDIVQQAVVDPKEIVQEAERLIKFQNHSSTEQVVDTLPSLKVGDISTESPVLTSHIDITKFGGILVHRISQATNGFTYCKFLFETSEVPEDVRTLIPVFTSFVMRMGADNKSYEDMSRLRLRYTGGASSSLHCVGDPASIDAFNEAITFQSSCLSSDQDKMLGLLGQSMRSADFSDFGRLRQLVKSDATSLLANIVEAGHSYARSHSSSRHSPILLANEVYNGLSHVARIGNIAARLDDDILLWLSSCLTTIGKSIRLARCSIVESDSEGLDSAQSRMVVHSEALPKASAAVNSVPFTQGVEPLMTFVCVPLDGVNNVALSHPTNVPYTHEDRAALQVLARIMSVEYLHRELREKGGAYGGGAAHSPNGSFGFYSYRDPHVGKTIESFSSAVQWCLNGSNITDSHVEQALLSIFGDIDAPMHPSAQGQVHFVGNILPSLVKEHRRRLLSLTPTAVLDAARRHFADFDVNTSSITVLGSENTGETLRESPSWAVKSLNEMHDPKFEMPSSPRLQTST
uniref:Peptidase M16C associated domain-containing protein n=1 Tax=Spongospora subterranea TaxID=70186 RepID=A0A0H5RGN4_9EUKA|eukprot:CRZ07834.1 hypothetical protein [Spongospora subterranea]